MIMIMPEGSLRAIPGLIEQANAQNKRKRNLRADRADNSRVALDLVDSRFDRAQPGVPDKVAFVEEYRVCVAKLVMGSETVKKMQAEIVGVRECDHRIDTNPLAKLRAQERQNYR